MNRRLFTRNVARGGVLTAISFVLFQFQFPLPFMPPFLSIDFSSVPVLIAGFAMGPWWGLAVQAVKSLLHLFQTSTGGIGELADFIMGGSFVLAASFWYWRNKTVWNAMVGLCLGAVALCAAGVATSYYILLPLYAKLMSMDAIIGVSAKQNAAITGLGTLILLGILPFNLIKGVIVSVPTLFIYKRVRPLLKDAPGKAEK